jgi:hypothetical protein
MLVALLEFYLIEHKGPTDDLEAEDALALLGYAYQYMRLVKVKDPAELCLMVVCDRISRPFAEQIERHEGTFSAMGGGLWRGKVSGFTLHGVETREACRQDATERLLYAFSRSYLADPEGILPLDPEEARVYDVLYQQVEQFRKNRGARAMKDYEAAKGSYEEVLEKLVERLPPEKRLRGLGPAQVVKAFPPEEVAEVLTPEQRLAGLAPEQRLAGLTLEQILNALPPEAREQLAKKLH